MLWNKNKGDAQCCGSYRGINLINHAIKIWEKIIEARLKDRVQISKQLFMDLCQERNYRCHVFLKNVDGKVRSGKVKESCIVYSRSQRKRTTGFREESCGTV